MANDRMYMRCRACGDMLPLGKHFLDGWYGAPAGEALQEWIDQHAPVWVHQTEYDEKVSAKDGHALFEVCYESDEGYAAKAEQWLKLRARLPESDGQSSASITPVDTLPAAEIPARQSGSPEVDPSEERLAIFDAAAVRKRMIDDGCNDAQNYNDLDDALTEIERLHRA